MRLLTLPSLLAAALVAPDVERKAAAPAAGSGSTKTLDSALEIKELADDGTFAGYGAVFGNVDGVGDVVKKGAFKRSLREHKTAGTLPKLLWQHNVREPIGAFTAVKEDDRGLYVEGQFALKTQRGAEAHELLKMSAVDGLSIGYYPVEWKWDDKTGVRTLLDVELFEISLVTFPANPEATASAKAAERIKSIRDFETFLRDEGGFSHAAAKAIASSGYKAAPTPRDEEGDLAELLASIDRASTALSTRK
jgi:uncharacterized protein